MIKKGVSKVKSKSVDAAPGSMARTRTHVESKQSGRRAGAGIPKMELDRRTGILNIVAENLLQVMQAGDAILLDESASLRPMVESVFFAVLSCPGCGTLGLITKSQYNGIEPVICGADHCSCRFRIVENTRFEFLRAS